MCLVEVVLQYTTSLSSLLSHTYYSNAFECVQSDAKEHRQIWPSSKRGQIVGMINVSYEVLEDNDQWNTAADVCGNGERHQGSKVPDEG